MNYIDPLELQRLIDGELDRSDLQRLLKTAELNPEQWREMAIAFAENQVWQSDFQNAGIVSFTHSAETSKAHADQTLPAETFQQYTAPKPTTIQKGKLETPPENQPGSVWWLSMAAGIVIALSMGFYFGNSAIQPDSIAETKPTSNETLSNAIASVPQDDISQVVYRPDYHMRLQDNEGHELLDSEIPLWNAETARQKGWSLENQFKPIPKEAQNRLSRLGYHVKQDVEYYSGRFDDGHRFVIPIQTINFSPGQ